MSVNYNIVNGHTLIDSPTMQCGVLVTKTISTDSDHHIYRESGLRKTTLFLLYKKLSMPGEPEIWSLPFSYLKYGETMKECAIRACNEYLKFPLMEEMLEQHKTLMDRTIIDDKHTGSYYNYAPITMMYTYQIESDDEYEFISTLYNKLTANDLEDNSTYNRANYLVDRHLTNNKIKNYNTENSIDHSKLADISCHNMHMLQPKALYYFEIFQLLL